MYQNFYRNNNSGCLIYTKKKKRRCASEENKPILNNFNNMNILVDKKFKIYEQELQPLLPRFSSFNSCENYLDFLKNEKIDPIHIYISYYKYIYGKLRNRDKSYKNLLVYDILYKVLQNYRKSMSLYNTKIDNKNERNVNNIYCDKFMKSSSIKTN